MACGLETEETEWHGPVAFYIFDTECFFKNTVRVYEPRYFLLILHAFCMGNALVL